MTIRDIDESLKTRLRLRAARHGRSMREEARDILRTALSSSPMEDNIYDAIRARIEPLGGVELELPVRALPPEPISFDE